MTDDSANQLVTRVATILDELNIAYALGGSLAASVFGEPRSTADVDIAVAMSPEQGARFLQRAHAEFYVPVASAHRAIERHDSFNLIQSGDPLKVDIFVLGDGLLDRRQIERRVLVALPGASRPVWVTSPEDQVLRKLSWFRDGGEMSDRQWRDIVGLIRVSRARLDVEDLRSAASELGLENLLEEAIADA